LKFSELVDIDELQALCESFTAITGAVTAILDLEGNILVATGWQDICTRFHRVNKVTASRCRESDTILAGKLTKGERYNIYRCKNGLVDVAVPITIRGEHVANFFTGQFLTAAPDKEYFIRQAGEFGFDKDAYMEALGRVPLFSEEAIRSMMDFFTRLAQFAGEMGLARKSAEEANMELQTHHLHLEEVVEKRTAELLLARDAANAASRAKSQFLTNMSHEIRTPMNAVLGFAQLLERDPSLSPVARNKVATIVKSGEHLLSIINDILEMSRIEVGRIELWQQPVDLASLLDDLAVMFRMRAEGKELTFDLDCAPGLPHHIMADLGKLRQVLINLLGNAVKFTTTGSILLRAFPVGSDRIVIEVHDSGIGITPEELDTIFRPFERTRSGQQAAGGTGLGLTISREYAQLMGGEISVESLSGKGSCFRFEFFGPMTSLLPASAETSRRVTRLASGQGEIRILVADDHSVNRELLRGMLEPLGFIVEEAADGREVLEKSRIQPPRIILMDLVMPGMDGAEATRILRATHPQESLAIIGITASAFEREKQQFIDAGINAYIAKPFREQQLYDLLARHAGIQFEFEESEALADVLAGPELPSLDKMSPDWRDEFRQVLARNNITRIRKLGEEAKERDPLLSAWLLERVGLYDMDGLKKLGEAHERGAGHG